MESTYYLAVGIAGFLGYLILLKQRRLPAPLPPGPKGWPVLGNIDVLPSSHAWVKYSELGHQYGSIVYLKVMGRSIVVINDAKYAFDMLAMKGRYFSDRPKFVMGGQLVGWDECPGLIPFSETWLEYRRLFSQFMGTKSKVEALQNVLHDETRAYIDSIFKDPQRWVQHSQRFSGGITLKITYGYSAEPEDDPLIKLADEVMTQFSDTMRANAYMVDLFPIFRFVPQWFPGASWKRKAAKYRTSLVHTVNRPYEIVKRKMADGTAEPCFVTHALENNTLKSAQHERNIQWAAVGIYGGGTDSTAAGIECFVLAMVLHTDEQIKAQCELDAVLGSGQLPTLSDRSRLPYVEALYTEVMRTYTFVPLGLPRTATEDVLHDGYFIPKGTTVISNAWQFLRDPKMYRNPECFDPNRFLGEESRVKEADPRDYLFGYGRFVQVLIQALITQDPADKLLLPVPKGMHLADATMWLACSSLLASFDIRPPEEDSRSVLPVPHFMDGSVTHPEHFECTIRPRVSMDRLGVSALH
ncbi:hypothetical protein EYR40_006891 [Pleurotus pulmonarius]|nr:hypothetical protein EYR40_006891 [Pleurotus pulmonarius]